MSKKIRLIVEDEQGNRASEQVYVLSADLSSLDSIDEAVEQFKNAALPKVEHVLLAQMQAEAVVQEKKTLADR